MARRVGLLVVHVEYLGYQSGLWCTDCRLSTGVRIWVVRTIGTVSALCGDLLCSQCRGHHVEDAPASIDDGSAEVI